ncbi:hypothetical protein LSH36_1109g00015 [Paralvinella palmiformis]|uniref:Uncharacterized protein n=1 Tax=Paralvinella palmiformis TaxID=53620 RepID=A0AAD9IWK6_9ANNE|nr:hypothetical protein LSH36_1109g00015 [Paralvinella palmiformis]
MKETRNYGSIGDPEPRQQSRSTPEVDGPWAWLIAASSLLIMINVCGVTFVSGIISSEFIANFHLEQNVAKGSIPTAVLQGLYLIAGR